MLLQSRHRRVLIWIVLIKSKIRIIHKNSVTTQPLIKNLMIKINKNDV